MQTLIRERKRISKADHDIVILEFWNYQFGYMYKAYTEKKGERKPITNYCHLYAINEYLEGIGESAIQPYNR